jgi:sigma-B regulation protein RsbU (phosphoserine phosphatase)
MGADRRARIGLFLAGGTYAYQSEIIYGAHDESERRGFDLFCLAGGRLESNDPRCYAYDIISPRNLDGAILVPGTWGAALDSAPVQELLERYSGIHNCVIGARWRDAPSVCIDNTSGVQDLTRHLIEAHQRRRIGFIAGRGLEAEERHRGYEQALRAAGLTPDPALFWPGDFSFEAGREAATAWTRSGRCECDAIVCANDWMAGGALEVLQERKIRVPEDVSLVGFDDIDRASFMSPPLTTIRQPPRYVGAEAVAMIGGLIAGEDVRRHVSVGTFPQIRRSCGCFGHASSLRTVAPQAGPALESFSDAQPRVVESLARVGEHVARDLDPNWAAELVDALGRDLGRGSEHLFLERLRALVDQAARNGNISAWYHIVSHLRAQSISLLAGEVGSLVRAETLFGRAYIAIGEQAEMAQGRRLLEREELILKLEDVSREARTALDWQGVCNVFCEHLPRFRIPRCYVAAGSRGADGESRLMFAFDNGVQKEVPPDGIPFLTSEIMAPEVRPATRTTLIVHPLFMQDEVLGYACFEVGPRDGALFKTLGDLASSALKATQMSRALIEEVTRREGAERARMRQELDIAARIQTAILPKHPSVKGLELATLMLPATEVGGDYFDILPCPEGCWIGIGDVAGHGLTAGLVMLMIQSIVAATVHERPEIGPGPAWRALNNVLSENIRERMGQEEHATLSLIRYQTSGRITFAGAHEDLLVYKPASGRCERIPTPGIWVGIGTEIPSEAIEEREYLLEPGDVLVLYTDGILEAKDASGQTYGSERLERIIEKCGQLPTARMCELVIQDVSGFMAAQDDDMTLVIARHGAGLASI